MDSRIRELLLKDGKISTARILNKLKKEDLCENLEKEDIIRRISKERLILNRKYRSERIVDYLKTKPKASAEDIINYMSRHYSDKVTESYIEENLEKYRKEALKAKARAKLMDQIYYEKKYAEQASKLTRYPEEIDLEEIGITRAAYRVTHGNISNLKNKARARFPSYFEYIYEKEHIDNKKLNQWAQKTIDKAKTLFITGITSAPVSVDLVKTLLFMAKLHKAVLVVIPMCKRIEDMDPRIVKLFLEKKIVLAVRDYRAHKRLTIKYVTQREGTVDPCSGLVETCKTSVIVGGASQRFKPVPVKNGKLPRCMMSTGVISLPFYRSSINHNKTPNSKTIVKAENNHFMSSWRIDKVSKDVFIPTQMMFSIDGGTVVDMGLKYYPDGRVERYNPSHYIFADTHGLFRDQKAVNQGIELARSLGIKEAVIHDSFDCKAKNPHEKAKKALKIANRIHDKKNSLPKELKAFCDELNHYTTKFDKVHIVDSNHDDMLQRWLDNDDFLKDEENGFLGALLFPIAVLFYLRGRIKSVPNIVSREFGIDAEAFKTLFPGYCETARTLEFATSLFGLKRKDKLIWMDKDDSYTPGGCELAMHGHEGSGGTKGSLNGLYKSMLNLVMGHTHSPEQRNNFFVLGHNQSLEAENSPHYIKGGTNGWIMADSILYEDGRKQHIFKIEGHIRKDDSSKILKLAKKVKPDNIDEILSSISA